MSILIPDMKMPDSCDNCFICNRCEGNCDISDADYLPNKRPDDCPLIELPPHGRLGDLDALMAEFEQMQTLLERRGHEFACSFMSSSMEISTEWYCVEDVVNAAPTIIPAEPGKEDESWN